MHGISALNFQRGKTVKTSLEITDLKLFQGEKQAQFDHCQSWIKIDQAGVTDHVDE